VKNAENKKDHNLIINAKNAEELFVVDVSEEFLPVHALFVTTQ